MTVSDINSEEMCQVSVSQAMKHMRPDKESEILNVEDVFPSEATQGEVWTFRVSDTFRFSVHDLIYQ